MRTQGIYEPFLVKRGYQPRYSFMIGSRFTSSAIRAVA